MPTEQDRLKSALDERSRLTAFYRRSKRAQFERAYEVEPRLRSFAAEIRHCGEGDAEWTISFVQDQNLWIRNADPETRALALEIVSTRIRQIREHAGLPPFDDALPGEEPDVFQIMKGILT